ncbi:hypothetical protein SAMN05444162_3216 [Paenibacillaceae bacterium GAS479]|nr:hypothetical protein SAMN05444162_3216 [Paenibacillaceae bacterium GAS479]
MAVRFGVEAWYLVYQMAPLPRVPAKVSDESFFAGPKGLLFAAG